MFEGRKLVIATKHLKETVIAPILSNELGVSCVVSSNLNTDLLGTFTGEFDRKYDPIKTAREKCLLGMELTNTDLAIASEGSFGPHPNLQLIPANEELLIFIDKKNKLEIIAREISTDTNFNGMEIKTENELSDFIQKVKFPTHALILKKSKYDLTDILKGVTDKQVLYQCFKKYTQENGSIFIETDMRAMYNPTRMSNIEKLTHKLVSQIHNTCPECKTPGFSVSEVVLGLPCENCMFPTNSVLKHVYVCKKCMFKHVHMYPNTKTTENPMFCFVCNP
jgi:hypothetical protein